VTAACDVAFGPLTVTPSAACLAFPGLDSAAPSIELAGDATLGEDAALVATFANAVFGCLNWGGPVARWTGAEAQLALTFEMPGQAGPRAHASAGHLTHPEAQRATAEPTLASAGLAVGAEI